ncbi:hypothetical protein BDR03DRAFT_982045 [Suillus americanus]|nr:hypothetical protein BDR03DRAFT_982045 [Suillus americanus]
MPDREKVDHGTWGVQTVSECDPECAIAKGEVRDAVAPSREVASVHDQVGGCARVQDRRERLLRNACDIVKGWGVGLMFEWEFLYHGACQILIFACSSTGGQGGRSGGRGSVVTVSSSSDIRLLTGLSVPVSVSVPNPSLTFHTASWLKAVLSIDVVFAYSDPGPLSFSSPRSLLASSEREVTMEANVILDGAGVVEEDVAGGEL